MGQWAGGSPASPYGRGAPAPSAPPAWIPPSSSGAPATARSGGAGRPGGVAAIAAAAVIVLLAAGAVVLAITGAGTRHRLATARSSLRATRAQLASVAAALATDTKALLAEQQVGSYIRAVRDDLAPALAAYKASGAASTASAARGDDEQAISALTSAKQKISELVLPDSLKNADADIRAAMESLSAGLESEVRAIQSQNLSGLDSALTAEGDALDHLQAALGEMYSAVGTAGPAAATS